MRMFPDRTLEELDQIDLPRHWRARRALALYEQADTIRRWMRGEVGRGAMDAIEEVVKQEFWELWRYHGKTLLKS